MNRILWISPNLTHYKKRFLNKLAAGGDFEITYLGIKQTNNKGYMNDSNKELFQKILIKSKKKNFGINFYLMFLIIKLLYKNKYNFLLVPVENKFTPLIFLTYFLKFPFHYTYFAYNHSGLRGEKGNQSMYRTIRKILFSLFDKVIFYTEEEKLLSLENNLVNKNKAYFANNTLDTDLIWDKYNFGINHSEKKTILFIGRLIPSKRLDLLFKYYHKLKIQIPSLKLLIIGDGPERSLVKNEENLCKSITWFGAVVNEKRIGDIIKKAHVIFLPGASGLSIVHSFCYGKPYITLKKCKLHGPELSYLEHNKNGCLLSGNIGENINEINELLMNKEKYEYFCNNAYRTAKSLSIQNWCDQIKFALLL